MTVGRERTHYRVTFAVLALGVAAFALLQSLVIPVLTTVQHELHTTQSAVTWVLTAVPGFLSTFLFCLFAVFSRPDIGLIVAALLFLPIALGAWFGYFLLQRRGRRYLAELVDYQAAKERLQAEAPR